MTAEDEKSCYRATTSKHANSGACCDISVKSMQSPEIALIGPWIIQCHIFFSSSKRTRGAIDESGWIFNGSESLGQARAWDDKLWGIKQRREWGKEVTQRGVAQTEGVREFRYRQRRIDLCYTSTSCQSYYCLSSLSLTIFLCLLQS